VSFRHRRLSVGVSLVLAIFASGFLAVRNAGTWLVVEDPLLPALAAVILGGHVPFRAMEAAAIYKSGLVSEVWITQGVLSEEDRALVRLEIEKPADHLYSVKVLKQRGVPGTAIHILEKPVPNTAEELRAILIAAQQARAQRVVLVTSKYHGRRVRMLWHSMADSHPQAIVRYAPDDPFDPVQWWRSTPDAISVSREWFGILNYWLGFPLKSSRI
jgi:uncharacterized SAM-binding protein YcdF (DUF218 family)